MTSLAPGARRALLVRLAGVVVACVLALLAVVDPGLGIAVALALFVAVGFLRSATFGVCAFACATYFEVLTEYAGHPALSPVKITGGALVLVAIVELATRSRHRGERPSPAWSRHVVVLGALLAFVALGFASAAWATNVAQVRSLSERLVTDLLLFLAVGVFLLRRSQLFALSCTVLSAGVFSTVLGLLVGHASLGRALGTFQDPNEYATAMVISIALGFGALGVVRTRTARVACLLGIATCAYGVLASQSRGGLVALAVAATIVVLSAWGRERARMIGATSILAAVVAATFLFTPTGEQAWLRITTGDSSGRADLWRIARAQFADEPLHGVGLGNYPAVASRYVDRDIEHTELVVTSAPRVAHNSFLEIAAELGVLGLVTFGTFAGGCVLVGLRALRTARRVGDMALHRLGRGVVAATIGTFGSCVFLSGQYNELLWVLLASCLGLAHQARRRVQLATVVDAARMAGDDLPYDDLDLGLADSLGETELAQLATLERA